MSSPLDLTTLAAVKTWLSIGATASDGVLGPLITAASRAIYANLGRASLLPRTFVERYDGDGKRRFYLRNWPVLSIASLLIWNRAVPAGTLPSPNAAAVAGYVIEPWDGTPPGRPQAIDVFGAYEFSGYGFDRGRQNIAITYSAGYQVTGEAQTVPATPYQLTVNAPYGPWATDQGVTYAGTGVALTPVANSPTQGQYSVSNGLYQFAAADGAAAVLISYGFVPQDVAQVATELVAERFSYRDRVGQVSKSLGGAETMSFAQGAMPKALDMMLQPYRAVMIPGV